MYSALSSFNTTTEVKPLSKAPNPQLLPGRHSINGCQLLRVCVHSVCVFTTVCVHFGWVNCRAQIPSMGHHTWPHVTSLHVTSKLTAMLLGCCGWLLRCCECLNAVITTLVTVRCNLWPRMLCRKTLRRNAHREMDRSSGDLWPLTLYIAPLTVCQHRGGKSITAHGNRHTHTHTHTHTLCQSSRVCV